MHYSVNLDVRCEICKIIDQNGVQVAETWFTIFLSSDLDYPVGGVGGWFLVSELTVMKVFIAACALATAAASSLRGDINETYWRQPVSRRTVVPKGWYVLSCQFAFANWRILSETIAI